MDTTGRGERMVENQEEWSGFRMGRERQLELAE